LFKKLHDKIGNEQKCGYEKAMKARGKFVAMILTLSIILILTVVIAISLGQVKISPFEAYKILMHNVFDISFGDGIELSKGAHFDIIWNIRFPRVILAMFIGAGLSICGATMQAVVQNPLADPYILGISSGATLGATFAILIGASGIFMGAGVALWAGIGAMIAAFMVIVLSNAKGKMTPVKLILSGVVVNAACYAFTNFIIYIGANAEGIKSVTFWNMGSLAAAKWNNILLPIIAVGIGIILILFQLRALNTMLLGDEAAVTLGLNLNKYRWGIMAGTSLITATMVASCGTIGFVGLIVPHIIRSLTGSDHRKLIPLCILCGAIFMVVADTFARILIKNSEIPIGIITSLVGAPLFMYLMIRSSYGFGDK